MYKKQACKHARPHMKVHLKEPEKKKQRVHQSAGYLGLSGLLEGFVMGNGEALGIHLHTEAE